MDNPCQLSLLFCGLSLAYRALLYSALINIIVLGTSIYYLVRAAMLSMLVLLSRVHIHPYTLLSVRSS